MPKKSKAPEPGVRLLRTKLNIPRPHPAVVELPELTERLEEGLNYKLILVSAPAGSGKTTLISRWVRRSGVPAAWVSLDSRDNDPVRFWTYVIAALRMIQPDLGTTALAMLQSPRPAPIEAAITELVNDIEAIQEDFLLVLDDYHLIETEKIQTAVSFLVDHLPGCLHLVIAGRSDPPLPLPLLRARRTLLEFKPVDLRFSMDATATFLNQVMRLGLTAEEIAAIDKTTEGWAAGIQLAALSMQGIQDVSGFIRSFSGRQRYIFDYLAEEVLSRQTEQIQEFLLKTSILDRFSAELCDSLKDEGGATCVACGSAGSVSGRMKEEPTTDYILHPSSFILSYLERSNLFIIPLDDERKWYRYHHLFADFLRSRLEQKEPQEEILALHGCASRWFENNHLFNEAIQHAISSGDFDRAAGLIFVSGSEIFNNSELISVMEWVKAFPSESLHRNLHLLMLYAWALLANSSFDQVETHLQVIERELGVTVASGQGKPDLSPQVCGDLAEIASIRANLAFHRMDLSSVLALSSQVLEYLSGGAEMGLFQSRLSILGVTAFNMALAYEFSGELERASEHFQKAIEYSQAESNIHLFLFASSHLAQLQTLAGRLYLAAQTYRQALYAERDPLARLSPISGLVHAGLGNILYEWNLFEEAEEHLRRGIELGRIWKNWETLLPSYSGLARLKTAQGDADSASGAIAELFIFARELQPQWGLALIEAQRASLQAYSGDLQAPEEWAKGLAEDIETSVPFSRQADVISQARALLVLNRYGQVLQKVDCLLSSGEAALQSGRLIEILALQAAALQASGETSVARRVLRKALCLAEQENFLRLFLDLNEYLRPVLTGLLPEIAMESVPPNNLVNYIEKLLGAPLLSAKPASQIALSPLRIPRSPSGGRNLSAREQEVLRLMADGLTNQQIADELVVSLNTVKTHVKNILACLEVQNRTQAIARARESGIL